MTFIPLIYCRALLVLCSLILGVSAIYAQSSDTLSLRALPGLAVRRGLSRFVNSSLGQGSIAGITFAGAGLLIKTEDNHFRDKQNDHMTMVTHDNDYHLQLVPAALMLGLKACGVKGESTWPQMLVADAASVAIMASSVRFIKRGTNQRRPDSSDDHSFPSGHTATGFMTATMLHHEYGYRYPWLSITAYSFAGATGFFRMYDHRHWLGDVMVGAGIGIVSTELGYLISNLIYHKPILKDMDYFKGDLSDHHPSFFSYYISLNVPLGTYSGGDGLDLKLSSGASAGYEGAWFPTNRLGIGGRFSYADMKFYANGIPQPNEMIFRSALAGVYTSWQLAPRVLVGIKALVGYNYYEALRVALADDEYIRFAPCGGLAMCGGVSLTLRASESLSYRFFCDTNRLNAQRKGADALHTLGIGAQLAVNF